jgi:hypothetical protein
MVTAAGMPYLLCAAIAPGATSLMNACCEAVSGTGVVADGGLFRRWPDAEDVGDAGDVEEAEELDDAAERTGRSSSVACTPGIDAVP